ncbi:MAG: hypothetical protein GKR94_28420 [Gammaproteobacteria bacterium]|nr:hypothetical protein [Gammaproteobacteria bacterium]
MRIERSVDLRFEGQAFELSTPIADQIQAIEQLADGAVVPAFGILGGESGAPVGSLKPLSWWNCCRRRARRSVLGCG